MARLGIKDEEFIRGKVPMTKAEIRAMVMVKAAIGEMDTIADIGAGTGSLSIEAALLAPKGKVYAIERNPEGIGLIRANAEKFECPNIFAIEGTAPEAMEALPLCDVILVGGSGGNMASIVDAADAHLSVGGRLVLTSVTAETTGEIVKVFEGRNYDFEGFEMQINRLRKLGRYHLYDPLSPIFIFTATKRA